jgi:hypothetical protein
VKRFGGEARLDTPDGRAARQGEERVYEFALGRGGEERMQSG